MYFDAVIALVSPNWGIGYKNELLYHIASDMESFKSITSGNVVVMGRKTFESLPNGALPNRDNVVITTNKDFRPKRCEIVHSDEDLSRLTDKLHTKGRKIFLIGGGSLYSRLINYCSTAIISKILRNKVNPDEIKLIDTYFPNLDDMANWVITSRDLITDDSIYDYAIIRYKNITLS